MKIGGREIGPGKPAYIIAEAGTAHAGKIETAMQFVEAAKNAGADAIKFQMFTPREELFCPMEGDEDRWAWWNQSMLHLREWKNVKQFAKDQGIDFFASVFQMTGIEWGKELEFPVWKVASRAATTFPYEEALPPFLISVPGEIDPPLWIPFGPWWLLFCVSQYPTPLRNARMREGAHGLSDHSGTIFPVIHAIAHGASVIEVHIKLNDTGPDAESSITPYNLKQICEARDAFAEMRQG